MSKSATNAVEEKSAGSVFTDKYLTFYIGETIYGVALDNVIEIIGIQEAATVPGVPKHIKGIINLRGRIVPVINARLKIGIEEIPYDERTCIIVINWNDSLVGLIVDRVAEVADFTSDQLSALPDFSNLNSNKYLSSVCKIGERLVMILDCDKFLSDETEATAATII